MRMPSKHGRGPGHIGRWSLVSLARFWLQTVSPFVCGVSTDWKSRQPAVVLPERDVVLRAAAEVVRDHLVRLRVEDPEPVVVAGDADVAPEREVGVRRPDVGRSGCSRAVMFGLFRRRGGWTASEGRDERKQEHEETGRSSRRWMLKRFATRVLGSNRNFASVLSAGTRVGYVAREAGAAELVGGPRRRGLHAFERDVRERRRADLLAHLLDRPRRGDELLLVGEVDAVEAGRDDRRRRDADVHLLRAGFEEQLRRSCASCCRGRSSRRRARRACPPPRRAG